MTDTNDYNEQKLTECEICLKEIPASEAKMSEAQDYTLYFCGLECYKQWQDKCKLDSTE